MGEARQMQKLETIVLDDIDGSVADATIRFGVDGAEYEIDLSAAHAGTFRDGMELYIKAARRIGVGQRRRAGRSRGASAGGPDPSAVREWAQREGIPVRDRGRVPNDVKAKFKAATGR